MYLYKIGYYSPEESDYFELCHENKYSEEELHKIVLDAVIRVLENVVSEKYDVYISKDFGLSYEEIDEFVIKELEKVGFRSVEYQAKWSCFGWQSLIDSDHWKGQRDEKSTRIFNELPAELVEKVNQMRKDY